MSAAPRVLALGVEEATLDTLGFGRVERVDVGGEGGRDDAPPALPEGDGWILVGEAVPEAALGALVRATASHAGRWTLFLVLAEGARIVPVSAGSPVPPGFAVERLEAVPGVFSLRHALDELARIRHDLNNPLTAALAETQLLRMDQDDEALAIIETQLQRLRDLIAQLSEWRVPR